MASITSEDKKILEGSEHSDLDYLIMDLEESDVDDFDLDLPTSPVLRSVLPRPSLLSREDPGPSTQPCKSSSEKPPGKISPVRSLEPSNGMEKKRGLSQPTKTSGNKQPDTSHSPVFHGTRRTIKLRTQARNVSPVLHQKAGCHPGNLPATTCRPYDDVALKKRSKRTKSFDTGGGDCNNRFPKQPHLEIPGQNVQDGPSDPDSDVISLYAADEDYGLLYTNNPSREVTLVQQDSEKAIGSGKENQRNVVLKTGPSSGLKQSKTDLRCKVPLKANADQQNINVAKITQLLDENTSSHTSLAASTFCKAYMDRNFRSINKGFTTLTRRLAESLLDFREMRYLYRIVRLAIDMQIVLCDRVLCGLIEHLGQNSEAGKISVIVTQMKEKSVVVSDPVHAIANRFLQARRPTGNIKMGNSRNARQTGYGRNICKTVCRQTSVQQTNRLRLQSQRSIPLLKRQISPQKKLSILRTPESNSALMGWSNEPLFVQIPNQNLRRMKKTAFGCKAHEKGIQLFETVGNLRDLSINNRKEFTSSGVDLAMLGKCIGPLAQAVGEHPIKETLFSAIAELFTPSKDRQIDILEVLNDDSPKFMLFVKSALEGLEEIGNMDKTKSWLAWIAAGVLQRFALESVYKLAQMMINAKVSLIPPSTGPKVTQAEKKTQYHIANKVVKACLSQNDLELALQVVEDYCVRRNYDPGPVLAPLLCDMLCLVASYAVGLERFADAAKCLAMLPPGFGDGKECPLMEKTLFGILNTDDQHAVKDENICNEMIEQMLTRSMATEVRGIIARAFCANVIPVFKYLESKGVYRRPQIAKCPHLILMPYILSIEEMALVIQRHFTELSEFLIETNQKLREDMPMRIVLCKNAGNLQPLSPPHKGKNMQALYTGGLSDLTDAVTGILDPKLRIFSTETNPQTFEHVIKLDITSVRMWMVANTDYQDQALPFCD